MIGYTVIGLPETIAKIKKMNAAKSALVTKLIQDTVHETEAQIKAELTFGHGMQTGTLRRSITSRMQSPLSGIVGTNLAYGAIVEAGAKPHKIYPKTRQWMAFEHAGKWIFARVVHHPGFKGYHMFQHGAESAKRKLQSGLGKVALKLTGAGGI